MSEIIGLNGQPARKRPTAGDVREEMKQLARSLGGSMGGMVRQERKRNRWFFGSLWLAYALLALYVLLS